LAATDQFFCPAPGSVVGLFLFGNGQGLTCWWCGSVDEMQEEGGNLKVTAGCAGWSAE